MRADACGGVTVGLRDVTRRVKTPEDNASSPISTDRSRFERSTTVHLRSAHMRSAFRAPVIFADFGRNQGPDRFFMDPRIVCAAYHSLDLILAHRLLYLALSI